MRYALELDISGIGFRWHRVRAGYTLKEQSYRYSLMEAVELGVPTLYERRGLAFVSNAPDPLKVEKLDAWRKEHIVEYVVPEGLHMTFADVKDNPEDARQFVNVYGQIGRGAAGPSFVDDFYAAQSTIRWVVRLARSNRASSARIKEIINRNFDRFLLRVTDTDRGKFSMRMEPGSLFAFMLLGAVRELTGSTWRHCSECGVPIEISDGRQARKRFCGNSCRQAAFRKSH